MPTTHAKLSPSSASRWLACPASVQMSEGVPDYESPAAREGTFAHALAELEVRAAFNQISGPDYSAGLAQWHEEVAAEYTPDQVREMEVNVADYVDLVVDRAKSYPDTVVFVERRVNTGVPASWGTSDTIVVSPEHVEIIDFKYGKGVFVEATGNPQLRLYACGALDEYGALLGDPQTVLMTVFQPRLENVSTETLTADQLRFWREEVATPLAEEALSDNPRFGPSDDTCRWCPAAGFCRARTEYVTRTEFGGEPDSLTPEEMGYWLGRFKEIRSWADAVEREALDKLYDRGEAIPGWKAVLSGGRRQITDTDRAAAVLADHGFAEDEVVVRKMAGLGVLDKLVGGKEELQALLGDLLTKTPGRPSLAPAEDGRTATNKETDVLDDLDGDI